MNFFGMKVEKGAARQNYFSTFSDLSKKMANAKALILSWLGGVDGNGCNATNYSAKANPNPEATDFWVQAACNQHFYYLLELSIRHRT